MAVVEFIVFLLLVCRSSSSSDTLAFVAVGDWGGQPTNPFTTATERYVAKSMGETAERAMSQFTIALGDNFYDTGVTDVTDPRFKETFEDLFTADSLQSRWYVVLGNHDHYGNASAEIAYTNHSKRWYLPDYNYTQVFPIGDSSATFQLVVIDTVQIAGLTDPYDHSLPPSGPASLPAAQDQLQWVESILKTSNATWLIVAGHYPVWSVAEHGPTQILVEQLRPMLEKYNATAYLCGHDHTLQHICEEDSTVEYYVSGAGHLTDSSMAHESDIPKNSLRFHYAPFDPSESHGGYTLFQLSPTIMNVTFYSDQGSQLYNTVVTTPRGGV